MSELAGVVLAGGQSSRMGTDKSLLRLPNSADSLLIHAQKTLTEVCGEQVFVSGAQHPNGIADIVKGCGPLSGIHAVLHYLQTNQPNVIQVLIMPVDMPNIRVEDLQILLEYGRNNHDLCCYENCYFPLFLPITTEVVRYIDQCLLDQPSVNIDTSNKHQQYSIKNLFKALNGSFVMPVQSMSLDNINTPQQWQDHVTSVQ